jgi:release factor glutamine methyltransferase
MDTIGSIRQRLLNSLRAAGIDVHEARREVDLIVQHVTGLSVAQQLVHVDRVVDEASMVVLQSIESRRSQRVPLQYCLGETWFMGLRMEVTPAVLIPRPDTEILVETVLTHLSGITEPRFADVGTGSGAIAVALLHIRKEARGYGIDVSGEAIAVARRNAALNQVHERLELQCVAWQSFRPDQLLDCIVSNPPYIPRSDAQQLQPEVLAFEPKQALFGMDEDGLGFYRSFSEKAPAILKPGAFIAVEVGIGQADAVARSFADRGWQRISVTNDLNKIPRVVCAFRPASSY